MSQNLFKHFKGIIPGTKTQNVKLLERKTPKNMHTWPQGSGHLVAEFQHEVNILKRDH